MTCGARGILTPIILLTARTQEAEKVLGLELGADDYVTKPFSPRELRARIKAVLRRQAPGAAETFRFGDVDVDFARAEVRRDGRRSTSRAGVQAARDVHSPPRPGADARAACLKPPGNTTRT